jgi:hypothetical protein
MECQYCNRELEENHYVGDEYNLDTHFCNKECEDMAILSRSCDITGESMFQVLKRRKELGLM